MAAMVTLLLGSAPVVGQSDPPDGGSDVGSDEPAEPDPSEGGGGGGSLLCGEFDISEGWDESDVPGLHACLFDSVKGAGSGEPSVRQGHDGDETVRSSACGDVDVEFVDEFVDSDPFGFSRRVRIVYFVHLTCEDGTPAVGVSTRATMVVGPGAGSGADDCSVVRGSGYSWVSPPAAGGCVSYDFHGNALAAHRFDLTRSQSSAFRQVLVWADVDSNGAYDPGEGFVLAPASPEPPLPSAPVGVSLASFADGSGVRVGWGRPTNHATAAPVGTYEVQWRASGEAAYPPANTVSAAVPPADVAGLTAGESYVLRVRAVDGAGRAGAWSTETTETARVLAAPGVVSTRSLSGMLRVSWEPPANQVGFVPVADYVVRWRPTSATNFDANNVRSGFSGLTVRGLTLGQTYALQARAVDIDGRGGAWSPEITATPQGPSGNGLRLPVSPVLVSNVAQPGASALGWASGSVRYAQRFTTGTADSGYWLEAAGIRFEPQARTIDDFDITAELLLETASGEPGAVIATLATPEVIVPGAVNWFYAPADTQLEPSNLYYLAVSTTDPGDYHQLIQTLSTGEDDPSAAGWSISNSAHSFDASRGAWNQIPGILQVDIRGTQPPAPPAKVSAVLVGGAAVEITYDADLDESSVPSVGAFSVRVDGAIRTISGVTVAGRVVRLTLASPITSAQRVTVSYTPPTTADAHGIETTNGDAAEGVTDQPVTIPPDPPTITGAESATGGLTVRWDAVADISGYDLEWRPDAEATWQPTRIDQQQHTISDLTDGALYWVRVRAVKTDGELTGQTLYTTAWSQPEPAIAGAWTPQNLQVTSGDRMLAVTWDTVAGADDYEVEYRVSPEGAEDAEDAEDAKTQRRNTGGARSVAPPLVAVPDSALPGSALAVLGDQGWAAHVTGIDNGTTYEVQVRAQRTITSPSGAVTLRSAPVSKTATAGLAFVVVEPSGPRVVRSGGNVNWTIELHLPRLRMDDPSPPSVPFAGRRIAAFVSAGPSMGKAQVRCLRDAAVPPGGGDDAVAYGPYGDCTTDDEGKVTLEYRAANVRTNAEVGVDRLAVFADYDGDGQLDHGEASTERVVGSTKVARPINLVALGDSYSAGENGEFRAPGGFGPGFAGQFYLTEGAGFDCRRWNKAYGRLLPTLRSDAFGDVETFACTGAISLNIFDADDEDYDGVHDSLGPLLDPQVDPTPDPAVRRVVETNRPSQHAEAFVWPPPAGGRDEDWEPRQGLSLRQANMEQTVDMVTLTIGGNDLGFADVLTLCYVGGCASYLSSRGFTDELNALGDALTEVFEAVKSAAPHAAVFVLGYPYLTPFSESDYTAYQAAHLDDMLAGRRFLGRGFLFHEVDECEALDIYPVLEAAGVSSIEASDVIDLLNRLVDSGGDVAPLIESFFDPGLFTSAGAPNHVENAANLLLKIDTLEKWVLKGTAERLNTLLGSRAGEAGVHFVGVRRAFAGHDQCGGDPWLNGVVVDEQSSDVLPRSGRSFHPNVVGHEQYASVLLDYIDEAVEQGAALNTAGLPVNPTPTSRSAAQRGSGPRGASGSSGIAKSASGSSDTSSDTGGEPEAAAVQNTVLWARRVGPGGVRCGGFLVPGDRVALSAGGFVADSVVSFSTVAATVTGVVLPAVTIPAATADAQGRIEATWTVPAVLEGQDSSTPRVYLVKATGTDTAEGSLVAFTPGPVLAYPGVAPCAVDDAATTTVGRPVLVAVLANDTAPPGGSLTAASVTVGGVHGGMFSVNATDGSLTFTPDPGFVGSVRARYRVADNWGMRVGAEVAVTVNSGCTITGTAGVVDITGTDGDDVICVPVPKDRSAFHIIDARAGDDVILGGDGVEWIHAGAGADVVYGRGGADEITGGAGVDTIHGGAGFDTIYSSDLADRIVDDPGGYEMLLIPPAAPAHVAPVVSDDAAYVAVGETIDIAVLDNDHDPNENLVAASLRITRAPTTGRAVIVATSAAEVAIRYTADAGDGVDTFAYEVCDTLDTCTTAKVTVTVGTAGCTILGSDGDDTLTGTAGPDVICGLGGDDVISGLGGDDVLVGGAGDDRLFGGDGADTLWGGPGGDALAGNRGGDTIHGGAGDDYAVGGGEDDTLFGGTGDDTLDGHAANDTLRGGPGRDILRGGNGDDTLFGGVGNDQLTGGAGADTLWGGADIDLLWGNTQNDVLHGGAGIDILRGGGGDDRLSGGGGNDQLHGNAGDDRLWGDTGVDSLDGGNGADYLDGGDGADACARGESTARCEQ